MLGIFGLWTSESEVLMKLLEFLTSRGEDIPDKLPFDLFV